MGFNCFCCRAIVDEKGIDVSKREKRMQMEKGKTQTAITCSKLTIETLEQGVKYVQS